MEYFDLEDDYKNIVIIEEYEGKISLIMGQLGADGTKYKRWGKLSIGKKGEDKFTKLMPWKVKLGDKQRAADIDLPRHKDRKSTRLNSSH